MDMNTPSYSLDNFQANVMECWRRHQFNTDIRRRAMIDDIIDEQK